MTMNEPLRPASLSPSTLGEILDRTAQLYRSRFFVFLGISVVPTVGVLVPVCGFFAFLVWLGSRNNNPPPTGDVKLLADVFLIAVVVVAMVAYSAVAALAMAAMNHAVARAYLGETATIRDSYKGIWRRGWRYIWLLILEGLVIGVAPVAAWIGIVAIAAGVGILAKNAGMGGSANDMLVGLAAMLAVVALLGYFFWMLLQLSLAFPACVIEQIGAWTALKRSWALSRGTKGRIFLLYLLGAALNSLLSLGITIPLAIIAALIPAFSSPQHAKAANVVMLFIIYGASFAVQALTRPIYGIALTLFYYDQRIRQEGFDIEWLMQRAGLVAPLPHVPVTQPLLQTILKPEPNDPAPPQAEMMKPSTEPPAVSGESV
jgi:hypothetical protein